MTLIVKWQNLMPHFVEHDNKNIIIYTSINNYIFIIGDQTHNQTDAVLQLYYTYCTTMVSQVWKYQNNNCDII